MAKDVNADLGKIKRIKTYIKGFDESMDGGIPEGHIVLMHGSAGTMKSSICFNILYNEAIINKKTGLYLSLEQSYESIIQNMIAMGYDMKAVNIVYVNDLARFSSILKNTRKDKGNIILVDLGSIRKQVKDVKVSENRSWLNVVKNVMLKTHKTADVDLVTFDSLSALYTLSHFENPRMELFYFFEFVRDLGLTAYMISEAYESDPERLHDNEAFLADGMISLRMTPFRRNIVREIKIDKMRATKCNNDVFSLEYKNGAFHALYGGQNPLL